MWVYHNGVFINLDHVKQIERGDEDEILLSFETHNLDWDDAEKYIVLVFDGFGQRENAYRKIFKMLGAKSFDIEE